MEGLAFAVRIALVLTAATVLLAGAFLLLRRSLGPLTALTGCCGLKEKLPDDEASANRSTGGAAGPE